MAAVVVVMPNEQADALLEFAGQVIVFLQDSVFHRLMPTLDLALGLRMVSKPDEPNPPLIRRLKRPKCFDDGHQ